MINTLISNVVLIQFFATGALLLIALSRGGGPEKLLAATLFGMLVVDQSYHALFGPAQSWNQLDVWHFFLDSIALLIFVGVALWANRFYVMVMAAAQVVAFTAHLVRFLVEPVSSLSYMLLYTMPFWFQMFVLAGGLARHILRKIRLGTYRDWRIEHHSHHRMVAR